MVEEAVSYELMRTMRKGNNEERDGTRKTLTTLGKYLAVP